MSQISIRATFVEHPLYKIGALSGLSVFALAAVACGAATEDDADFYEDSAELAAQDLSDEVAESDPDDDATAPSEKQLKRPATSSELPNATCEADRVFGNVICVECTPGPFPTCKNYVCDKEGKNCKQTSRALPGAIHGTLTDALLAR